MQNEITPQGVVEILLVQGLFKKAQMRGVYRNTLSGAVCSATRQMSVFQQSQHMEFLRGRDVK
jgi:hypothetical protein